MSNVLERLRIMNTGTRAAGNAALTFDELEAYCDCTGLTSQLWLGLEEQISVLPRYRHANLEQSKKDIVY